MTTFVVILVAVWVASFGAWWFMSSALKSVDADKIKTRLLGEAGQPRKGKSAKRSAPLIEAVNQSDGQADPADC